VLQNSIFKQAEDVFSQLLSEAKTQIGKWYDPTVERLPQSGKQTLCVLLAFLSCSGLCYKYHA